MRELSALGWEQVVVGRRGGPLLERLRGRAEILAAAGRLEALRRLRGLAGPKIVHAHTGNTVPLAVLGRGRGDVALATRRLDRPASRFWLARLDRVVAISRSVERSLLSIGLDPGRVERIPSAIDGRRALDPALRAALRGRLGLGEGERLGLTIGALEPQKDPLTLCRALALADPRHHHAWVGAGSLLARARELARERGVAGRLHLPGFDADPDKWFAAADVFVLPSVHEGLGTVLLDAFHFGVPVVASSIPGSGELVEHEVTALLFAPGDAAGLAACLAEVARDAPGARARVAEAHRRVLAYDIRATAACYARLYEELAAARALADRS